MHPIVALAGLLAASSALASPQYPGYGPGGQDGASGDAPGPTFTASSAPAPALPSSSSSASPVQTNATQTFTGDAFCAISLCVGALVNGSTVQYTLQSTGLETLGWMALGFGTQMTDAAMVIMWPNSDGTITISQRSTTAHVMPTPDAHPPFSALALPSLSVTSTTATHPKLVFSRPLDSSGKQSVVYAFGTTNPESSAQDARITQHTDHGASTLDLSGALTEASRNPSEPVSMGFDAADPTSPIGNGTDTGSEDAGKGVPFLPYQRLLIAHGIMCALGFLVLLPFGALVARYFRTVTRRWYTAHWVLQFGLGFPIILTGISLGIASVQQAGAHHLDDSHKRFGILILSLYIIQLTLGALVHYVKPRNAGPALRRPWHNFVHVALGLGVIGLGFHQVRDGYREEWVETTGRSGVGRGVDVGFWIWVVLMPLLYAAGLWFVRKQFEQEREGERRRLSSPSGEYMLGPTKMQGRYARVG